MRRYESDPPASLAVQLDQLADRFEAAWRSGARPQIEEFLDESDAPRRDVLTELLLLEWELRHAAGQRQTVDEYQRRFPDECDFVACVLAAVEHSVGGDTSRGSEPTLTEAAPRELPGEFGDYTLLEVLGRGGMGVVYKARQRSLDRLVAVKLLRSGAGADEADVERFRREAEAAARLDHPQIVSIFEVGRHTDEHFFSMEYVAGRSLAALVAEHPLEPRRAARYLRDVAAAIHYSHQQGILHRDLKPSNVLVDRFDRPRVMDFGLARRIETDARLTATGALLGTPSYMPPEQAGDGALGPPADVYAMGAMLYELLTGRPPFQAATALDTLMMVMDRAPIPPRQLNAKVPRDLETICLKCLEKSPGRRYATAEALGGDLDRFIRGVPIAARPVTRLQRLGRWCRRNPALAGLGGLAAAALLAAAGLLVALAVSQSAAARRLAEENQATQAALGTATTRGRELEVALSRFRESQANATIIALNHSEQLCEQGDHAAGLLWLATGLQLVPEENARQQWSVRMRMAVWQRHLNPFAANLEYTFDDRPQEWLFPLLGPDGKKVLTGRNVPESGRGEARVWDAAGGQPLTPLLHHGELLESIALSSDGQIVLTAGRGEVKLWDAETGAPRMALQTPLNSLRAATFGPDGASFVVVSTSAGRHRFETATGRSLDLYQSRTPAESESLRCLCPDLRNMLVYRTEQIREPTVPATRSDHRLTVRRRDLASGDAVGPAIQMPGFHAGTAISRDCRRLLVSAGTANDIVTQLWDVNAGSPLGPRLQTAERIHHATFSPAGDVLLTFSGLSVTTNELRLWDADTAEPLGDPLRRVQPILAVGFLPKRDQVWLLTIRGGIRWEVDTGRTIPAPPPAGAEFVFPTWMNPQPDPAADRCSETWAAAMLRFLGRPLHHPATVEAARFSPDGTRLATSTNHRTIRQWNVATGEQVAVPVDITTELWGYSEDGQRVVTKADFDELVFDATRPIAGGAQVRTLAYTNDYSHIVTGVGNPISQLLLIETATRQVVELPLNGVSAPAFWAAVDPVGSRVVAGSWSQPQVWMWNLAGTQQWTDPELRAYRGTFGPDGRILAVSADGQTVQLLHAETGQPAAPPLPHPRGGVKMAFSSDGKLLATRSLSAVRFWEVATGKSMGVFMKQEHLLRNVRRIEFSPDGETLLCFNPAVHLYPAPQPLAGSPAELQLATEVLTGMTLGDNSELSDDGRVRVLGANEWHDKRRRLEREAASPPR